MMAAGTEGMRGEGGIVIREDVAAAAERPNPKLQRIQRFARPTEWMKIA